jgi:nitroimidazol reductase NimA-like FMN-containing flavoprotein (pyridoxamine 5'-phosphate oxidase superfamily)
MATKDIVKIPYLEKIECAALISDQCVCRIAFKGEKYPYIAPFVYVCGGDCLYFLSTDYGEKIRHFQNNPLVAAEIEKKSGDLSEYEFVVLNGRLMEVELPEEKLTVRRMFVQLLKERNLSRNILAALGCSPEDPLEILEEEGRTRVWKLTELEDVKGFKDSR